MLLALSDVGIAMGGLVRDANRKRGCRCTRLIGIPKFNRYLYRAATQQDSDAKYSRCYYGEVVVLQIIWAASVYLT